MMDAGRELDATIAEKVMKYTLNYEFADMYFDGAPCVRELRDQDDEWGMLPNYSTEWSAVEQVVFKMGVLGYWCQMRTPFQAGILGDGYWAGFTPHGTSGWNGRPDHWTQAETLPLAICLAALATVMEEPIEE